MTDVHPMFQPKKRDEDVATLLSIIADLKAERNYYRKEAQKTQDRLNRVHKLLPGATRIWNLDRIAIELEAEAECLREENVPYADPEGLERDALYLRRLEYDLISLREALGRHVRGSKNRKYDPSQWPRGPRP